MNRAVGFLVAVAVLGLGIWGLLVQFQTETIETPLGSRSDVSFVVVDNGSPTPIPRLADALWGVCLAELKQSPVQPLAAVDGPEDRFRGILAPALDRFEERELRGCLNDLVIPDVRGTDVRIELLTPEEVGEAGDVDA